MSECSKHKGYKGRKKPKYECTECLALFIKVGGVPRAGVLPTRVIPDKTKYNRKAQKRLRKEPYSFAA